MSTPANLVNAQISGMATLSSSIGMEVENKTTKRPSHHRRLDQLAWLLEGTGVCSAIAEIGGKFYVSANAFFCSTQNNNSQLVYVRKIMNYFGLIANDLIKQQQIQIYRNDLMKLICEAQIKATRGMIRIPQNIFELVVSVAPHATISKLGWGEVLEKNRDLIAGKTDLFYVAVGLVSMIFNRIRKIEDAIVAARTSSADTITKEQFAAFLTWAPENILLHEQNQGVHAELQILSSLIASIYNGQAPAKEVYIGISKRCCFDCNNMLTAASDELLKQRGIKVLFGGAHDASFTEKWVEPSIFDRKDDPSTIEAKIWKKYKEFSKTRKDREIVDGTYGQRHETFNSEFAENPEEKFSLYMAELEDSLCTFNIRDPDRQLDVHSNIRNMLELGLTACRTTRFKDLFDDNLRDGMETDGDVRGQAKNKCIALIVSLKNQSAATPGDFLKFLKNRNFVPFQIAEYFSKTELTTADEQQILGLHPNKAVSASLGPSLST